MNVLDLFSGIGGFSLGLERAGFLTVAFCEIEPYARAVLRKHWPKVPCYADVRELTAARLAADGVPPPEVLCGGFPCQDVSNLGKRAGIDGERSGLFSHIVRIVRELKEAGRPPLYVILENVSSLRSRGLDGVLRALAAVGYDAEWHCIPASAVGAEHDRDRVWIIAYPAGSRVEGLWPEGVEIACPLDRSLLSVRDRDGQWKTEPDVRRVADGIPSRVDRLRCLGNAVVPQIPEIIGRAIIRGERK